MTKQQKEVQQAHLDEEEDIIRELTHAFAQAQDDCVNKIIDLNSRRDMQNLQSIIYQKQYQTALKSQMDVILDSLLNDEFEDVSDYLTRCYENGYVGTMYDIQSQGIPLILPINQEQVVKAVQTDSKISTDLYTKLGEDITDLKKNIRREVSRGIASGSSWWDVADALANKMTSPFEKAKNNAARIARTEGHRIQQESQLDAMYDAKDNGADMLKQWDATLDSRTRPDHKAADGQIVELDEYFTVGGEKLKAPGVGGSAKQVCNCRCCLLSKPRWALDDDELNRLKERAEYYGLDKTKDFEEFKKKYLQATNSDDTISLEEKLSKYKTFGTNDMQSYDAWKTAYDEQNSHITEQDKEDIKVYTDGSFEAMNAAARYEKGSEAYEKVCKKYGEENLDSYAEMNKRASTAIKKYKLEDNIMVHRYVRDVNYITGSGSSVDDITNAIGGEYTDKGFSSTCLFERVTRKFGGKDPIHLQILVNKGASGAYINDFSEKKNEEFEFVLDQGTTYRVLDGGTQKATTLRYDTKNHKWVEEEIEERYLILEVVS